MRKKKKSAALTNPNDDSPGQCYAPVEKGSVNKAKKKHIPEGKTQPRGWVMVQCDASCHLSK